MKLPILLIITAALSVAPSLRATSTTFTFATPTNSASATFSITPTNGSTAGTVQITLMDNQANPTDISQLVGDLEFTLGLTGASTFAGTSSLITISKSGPTITSSTPMPTSSTG